MNIVIVEDEPKSSALLKELIEEAGDHLVIGICDSIESTVALLSKRNPPIHLFFMDIQLADGLSFDIFKRTKINCPVVFCTAYDNYALEAFKSNGIDYILKPFREEDVLRVFEKINNIQLVGWSPDWTERISSLPIKSSFNKSFLIKKIDEMYPLHVDHIVFVCYDNEILYLFSADGARHVLTKSIDEVERSLDPNEFFRINRQMIVARKFIKSIEPFFNRKVIVKLTVPTTEPTTVSRLKVSAFLKWIEKY